MSVYCPYCREDVEYEVEKRNVKEFRNVKINTYENVAVCKKCHNDLYVNDIEDENMIRLNEIYKKKANIIDKQEIIDFRKRNNLSQRELTSILGFGKMTINRYEQGKLPTKSHSDYLKLLINNQEYFLQKVEESYKAKKITSKTYKKVIAINNNDYTNFDNIQDVLRRNINNSMSKELNIYNGYKEFDLELVENIISYIASKVNNLTITSLNKYLYFIDFISFNQRCVSITGLEYQKMQFGPVIKNQKYKEISLLDDKYIRYDFEDDNCTKTIIVSNNNYNLSELKPIEIEIIDKVIELLKDKTIGEISNLSHLEQGWIKTKDFDDISFEYANNLNILK